MSPVPPRLSAPELRARLESGATLVDFRDPRAFGAGHIAGSLNVAIDSPQLGERVSWFAPPGCALVLLVEREADLGRALPALARVGLSDLRGYVVGAAAVQESGLPVASLTNVTAPELASRLGRQPLDGRHVVVLDVREPVEWEEGHVPDALHIPMREVAGRLSEVPRDRPVALMCRGGARSSLVGSMLLAHGFTDLLNAWGGMSAWLEAGLPLARD
jgi:hydroxyacylglutathione hydrolase